MVELDSELSGRSQWIDFPNRQAASAATASLVAATLTASIAEHGQASFLSSGGSTPAEMLDMLSHQALPWSQVTVGLVDDRFVPPEHPASNEGLLRRHLFQGAAIAAGFIPLWTADRPLEFAADDASTRYQPLIPADIALLGMGTDGHTASWFPGASTLKTALSPNAKHVVAMDATGCAVAGDHAFRLTLSAPAIAQSKRAILLIFGEEKKSVFERALTRSVETAPIRSAVENLQSKLIIAWAP